MPDFEYRAIDAGRGAVSGHVTAHSESEARDLLAQRGLTAIELSLSVVSDAANGQGARLSTAEAEELSQQLVDLAGSPAALAAGFLAAAEESESPHVALALRHIAQRIEQGESLNHVLEETATRLPQPIRGIVAAAARTGDLPAALGDLAEHHREVEDLRRKVWSGLTYSGIVGILAAIVVLILLFVGTRAFETMFLDFGLKLQPLTLSLFWWRDVGIWLVVGGAVVVAAASMAYRSWRGDASWMRLIATIPLFGPLSYWRGVAEWSGLLSILIKHRLTPADALRQCAAGAGHATFRELSRELAEGVSGGQSLSSMLAADPRAPSSLVPFVNWGEQLGTLPEAFDAVRDMFTRRVQARTAILHAILPPTMFIVIGCFVLMIVGGLFMPLGVLIYALSQ